MTMAEQWGPTKKATLQQISEDVSFSPSSFFTTSRHNSVVCVSITSDFFSQVKDQVEKTTGKDFEKYRACLYRKSDTNPGVMKEFLIKVINIVTKLNKWTEFLVTSR